MVATLHSSDEQKYFRFALAISLWSHAIILLFNTYSIPWREPIAPDPAPAYEVIFSSPSEAAVASTAQADPVNQAASVNDSPSLAAEPQSNDATTDPITLPPSNLDTNQQLPSAEIADSDPSLASLPTPSREEGGQDTVPLVPAPPEQQGPAAPDAGDTAVEPPNLNDLDTNALIASPIRKPALLQTVSTVSLPNPIRKPDSLTAGKTTVLQTADDPPTDTSDETTPPDPADDQVTTASTDGSTQDAADSVDPLTAAENILSSLPSLPSDADADASLAAAEEAERTDGETSTDTAEDNASGDAASSEDSASSTESLLDAIDIALSADTEASAADDGLDKDGLPIIPPEQADAPPPPPLTLTQAERNALIANLTPCWSPPIGAPEAESLIVNLQITLDVSAEVLSIRVLDDRPTDRYFQTAVASARRALRNPRCQPLTLPKEKYELWKTTIIRFDPQEMLGYGQ